MLVDKAFLTWFLVTRPDAARQSEASLEIFVNWYG